MQVQNSFSFLFFTAVVDTLCIKVTLHTKKNGEKESARKNKDDVCARAKQPNMVLALRSTEDGRQKIKPRQQSLIGKIMDFTERTSRREFKWGSESKWRKEAVVTRLNKKKLEGNFPHV